MFALFECFEAASFASGMNVMIISSYLLRRSLILCRCATVALSSHPWLYDPGCVGKPSESTT